VDRKCGREIVKDEAGGFFGCVFGADCDVPGFGDLGERRGCECAEK
jgi:hypothetical protein